MGDYALAAFAMLRAHAAEETNLQDGSKLPFAATCSKILLEPFVPLNHSYWRRSLRLSSIEATCVVRNVMMASVIRIACVELLRRFQVCSDCSVCLGVQSRHLVDRV